MRPWRNNVSRLAGERGEVPVGQGQIELVRFGALAETARVF